MSVTTSTPDRSAPGPIVIVGAGQAGGRAAEALRSGGHAGPITLIGAEAHPPYERPALSKEFLSDDGLDTISWVRPRAWYEANDITLLSSRTAVSVDRHLSRVALEDGSEAPFATLIIATGARPRPLAVRGADHPLVTCLRTIEDSLRLRTRLAPGAHIAVIGAGFVGLEVAAAARARGARVTILELADLPLMRCVPPVLGSHFAELHRGHGVAVRTGTRILGIEDRNGKALVLTDSGEVPPADAVVVGIGIIPNTGLGETAGLAIDDGIVIDEFGRTADPRIYAIGDVSRHFNPLLGRSLRLESWQHAQNHAIAVARNVLGARRAYAQVPWFWSDQFDVNLQMAGLAGPEDEVIQRGRLGAGPTLYLHLRDGRLTAAIGIDAGRDVRVAREIIALGGAADATALADESFALTRVLSELKRASRAA